MKNIVLIRPYITEKTMTNAARGWFTFVVRIDANKAEIAKEIHEKYKVTVTDVKTIIVHGKTKRVGRRQQTIQKSNWKKAMVQLAPGQTIDAFQLGETKPAK